ncbi:unnamed protein product [Rotaria sp. Silwood1]|nr:unnamed protein product [Rotaria sp. Silwood1]CAF1153131.1 unnamed protein product [Rotaria sp. Silwood1]
MEQNWDYHGNDLGKVTIQTTYADCCDECSKNDKCNAFTWNSKTHRCLLKSSVGNGGSSTRNTYGGRRQGFQSIGNEQCCTKNGQVYSITVQPNESIEAELILISVEDFLLPIRTYLLLINVEDLSQASKSQSALCPQRELSANEQQVLQPSHPSI